MQFLFMAWDSFGQLPRRDIVSVRVGFEKKGRVGFSIICLVTAFRVSIECESFAAVDLDHTKVTT
jgi:hypothetical protein